MAMDWNALFGQEYFITLTNEERRYLALDPIRENWDITRYCSKTNITYTRTTVFWEKDEIRKIIHEENRLLAGQTAPVYRGITEHDTVLKTENREKLIPLTARGKPKPVTASNILSPAPFGCSFHFSVDRRSSRTDAQNDPAIYMAVYNTRSCRSAATGEEDRLTAIRSEKDFHSFMQYYMATCPDDYFDRINLLRTARHQTVKYRTGDVFRIEIDRFRYCYGLITGSLRDIQKWPELPDFHSLRKLMAVPIMVRYYKLITERSDMTARELSQVPLGRMEICADNDIIWGSHTITDHKELTENDIEFHLVCTKVQDETDPHITTHSYDFFVRSGLIPEADGYRLYVEWGTAATFLPSDRISERLKAFLKDYSDPHGGVKLSIFPDLKKEYCYSKSDLLNPANDEMRAELFRCLGLSADADFDAFAAAFGGLTKKEILKRLPS